MKTEKEPLTAGTPLTTYWTQWQAAAAGGWQTGLDLGLGFTVDPETGIPQPIVHLAGQVITEYTALTVDASRCLVITVNLTSVSELVCGAAQPLYLQCAATLSADGRSFTGNISQLCSGTVNYPWQGHCESLDATWLHAMNRMIEVTAQRKENQHECQ